LVKQQVGKMVCWINDKLMQWQIGKGAIGQNGKSAKWQISKMANWWKASSQNGNLAK
jgi:hypothetical protein